MILFFYCPCKIFLKKVLTNLFLRVIINTTKEINKGDLNYDY